MTELSPQFRDEQIFEPGWLRRVADRVMGVDPEARRAQVLREAELNRRENEVMLPQVMNILNNGIHGHHKKTGEHTGPGEQDYDTVSHDRSDMGLRPVRLDGMVLNPSSTTAGVSVLGDREKEAQRSISNELAGSNDESPGDAG